LAPCRCAPHVHPELCWCIMTWGNTPMQIGRLRPSSLKRLSIATRRLPGERPAAGCCGARPLTMAFQGDKK
jgi:hypothetical protein